MDLPMILAATGIGIAILLAAFLSIYQQGLAKRKKEETVRALRAANRDAKDPPPGATPFFIACWMGNDARFFRVYRGPGELLFVNAGPYFVMIDADTPRGAGARDWMLRSARMLFVTLASGAVMTLIALAVVALGVFRNPTANPAAGGSILLGVMSLAALLALFVVVIVPVTLWRMTRRAKELDALSLAGLRELVATDPKSFRAGIDDVAELNVALIDSGSPPRPTEGTRIAISFKHASRGRWKIETLTTEDTLDAVRATLALWGPERARVADDLRRRLIELGHPALAGGAVEARKFAPASAEAAAMELPRPPQADEPPRLRDARPEKVPLGTFSVNGCGTMVCEGRGLIRWDSSMEDSDSVLAFCLLGIPLVPYRAVHTSNWQADDASLNWQYRCHPVRWTWDLVAAAFLRSVWVWMLVAGGICLAIPIIAGTSQTAFANQPDLLRSWWALGALGFLGALIAACAVGLRLLLGIADERHRSIRAILGRHPLGSSDPAFWTPELLRGVRSAAETFGAATYATAVPALTSRGDFRAAMFAARLSAATEHCTAGERLTDSLLAHPEVVLALERFRRRAPCHVEVESPTAWRPESLFR